MNETAFNKFIRLYNEKSFMNILAEGKDVNGNTFVCSMVVRLHETFIGFTFTVDKVYYFKKGDSTPYHNDFISSNMHPEVQVDLNELEKVMNTTEISKIGDEILNMLNIKEYLKNIFKYDFTTTYKWL